MKRMTCSLILLAALVAVTLSSSGQMVSPRPVPTNDFPTAAGPYKPTWQSLAQGFQVPQWFQEAKFGIWSHWSPQPGVQLDETSGGVGELAVARALLLEQSGVEGAFGNIDAQGSDDCHDRLLVLECGLWWKERGGWAELVHTGSSPRGRPSIPFGLDRVRGKGSDLQHRLVGLAASTDSPFPGLSTRFVSPPGLL
jgi:hypothetical protein